MKVEYRRDMYNNYMVFKESEETAEDSYGLKMLVHNKISGLLKLEVRVIDNQKQYYYDITSKQPMQWVFQKGQLSGEQIKKIMEGIFSAIEGAREFLLSENDFLLDPEYIYISLSSFQIELCYRPGYNHGVEGQLTALIEYIMDKVDYKKEDAVLLSYGLYKVSRSGNCNIHELKQVLNGTENPYFQQKPPIINITGRDSDNTWGEKKENEAAESKKIEREKVPVFEEEMSEEIEVKKYAGVTWAYCGILTLSILFVIFICGKTGFFYNPIDGSIEVVKAAVLLGLAGAVEFLGLSALLDEKKKVSVIKEQEIYVKTSYGEGEPEDMQMQSFTRELSGMEEEYGRKNGEEEDMGENTVLLGSEEDILSFILSPVDKGMYQDINLVEFPFFIGKLKTKVDFSISNNTISRFHAKLEREGEDIFLTDLHSTNGTFLNGERILANERRKVSLRDRISFANVMYILEKI